MAKIKRSTQTVSYGYTINPNNGEKVEDVEQQAVIDRIIRECVADFSYKMIADTLNGDGVPSTAHESSRARMPAVTSSRNNRLNRRVVKTSLRKANRITPAANSMARKNRYWLNRLARAWSLIC